MSVRLSSVVDCGSWVVAVCVQLVCQGCMRCGAWGRSCLGWSFLGESVWGRVGVMGCLWWVSLKPLDKPAGDVLLYLSSLAGCFPWRVLPWAGMSCIQHMCSLVGGLCVGCGSLAFMVSLWWGLVDV